MSKRSRIRVPVTLSYPMARRLQVQGYTPSILMAGGNQEADIYELRDRNNKLCWASVHPDLFETIALATVFPPGETL